MAIYNNDELIKYYEDAALKNKNDITSLYGQQAQTLGASRSDIYDAYAKAKSGAYATSRISALGNNEQLAAQGLAGNAYAKPTSGYSETSRIYQDVALQNNLNQLGESQRNALQELQAAIRTNQQNKMSAINQSQDAYNNLIMNARQNAYNTNFELDKQNAAYLAQMAGQGVQLDDTQQALLGRYGYNYGQISQLYQDEIAKQQQQQQDKLNAGFINTYRDMLDKGQTLTPEQKAIFDQYSGMTTDQYNSYLEGAKQKQLEAEQNYNASIIDNAILDGSLMYGDSDITAKSLQEMKESGIINDKIYNMILPQYQAARAEKFEQTFNEIGTEISKDASPANIAKLAKLAQDIEKAKGKDISISDYNNIKKAIDTLEKEYRVTADPYVGSAKFTNGNDLSYSGMRNLRNVKISVGNSTYELEISPNNDYKDREKAINAGLKNNGDVVAVDGKIYTMVMSGGQQGVYTLERAEKAKGDYDKLLQQITRPATSTQYTVVDSSAVRKAITDNTANASKYLSTKLPTYGDKTAQEVLDSISNSTSMTAREKAQRKSALYNEIAKAIS